MATDDLVAVVKIAVAAVSLDGTVTMTLDDGSCLKGKLTAGVTVDAAKK